MQSKQGLSPLMTASQGNFVNAMEFLLEFDADVDLTDKSGKSALIHASERGHTEAAKLILQHEGTLDHQDIQGRSALMIACENKRVEMSSMLIDMGADQYLKNNEGKTALDISMMSKKKEMLSPFTKLRKNPAFPGILFSDGAKKETVTTNAKKIDLLEEVGISLTIPKDALPSTDPPLDLHVQPCFSGSFQVPKDVELVSPAYIVKPSREVVLEKDVSVKLCHHANLETEQDCRDMVFLSASKPPHTKTAGKCIRLE